MYLLINNGTMTINVIVILFALLVLIGNFFKKKSILGSVGMYGEIPVFIASLSTALMTVIVGLGFLYRINDDSSTGISVGSVLSIILYSIILLCVIGSLFHRWYKSIPET